MMMDGTSVADERLRTSDPNTAQNNLQTSTGFEPANSYVTGDDIPTLIRNKALGLSTVGYSADSSKQAKFLESVSSSTTDQIQNAEMSGVTENVVTELNRSSKGTPSEITPSGESTTAPSVIHKNEPNDRKTELKAANLIQGDSKKQNQAPATATNDQEHNENPVALPIISYHDNVSAEKKETGETTNTSERDPGDGMQPLTSDMKHLSTPLLGAIEEIHSTAQPTPAVKSEKVERDTNSSTLQTTMSHVPGSNNRTVVSTPPPARIEFTKLTSLDSEKRSPVHMEFNNLTSLDSEKTETAKPSAPPSNPLGLQPREQTGYSQGERNVSTVKTSDPVTNAIMDVTTPATGLPASVTTAVINADKNVSANNVFNVTVYAAVKTRLVAMVTSGGVDGGENRVTTPDSANQANRTTTVHPLRNETHETNPPLMVNAHTTRPPFTKKLPPLNKGMSTTQTTVHKSSTMKTANTSTIPPFAVDAGNRVNMVPILVPAVLSVAVLVALIVFFIYWRKCRSSPKYRKGIGDEVPNEVMEEKVYLELIYAKVDLSKKCKYWNGPDSNEESTPLTLEDSSNNNSTLNNRESGDIRSTRKDSYNASSCESDVFDEDPIEPATYENTKVVFEPLEEYSPPLPFRNTPRPSPKTTPGSRRGKSSTKCSPCVPKRSPKKSSPVSQKSNRTSCSSPERTPKCKRTSPKVKKSRSPLVARTSQGVCCNTQKSDEDISQNIATDSADHIFPNTPVDNQGSDQAVLDFLPCVSVPEPVACTSRCTGACGGACGAVSPTLPTERPALIYSRNKELPREPEGDDSSEEEEPLYDAAGTSGRIRAGTDQPEYAGVRDQGAMALNHSYDPVYVPRSDANAMSRRLDKSGYVTSKLQRAKARGDPYAEVLMMDSDDHRPIPTIMGPPIMKRRPASRASSDRSTDGRRLSKSSHSDNPQDHIYSSVAGARESSSTEQGSLENVYASVAENDEDARQYGEGIYETAEDPRGEDHGCVDPGGPSDEIYAGLDCMVPSPDGDNTIEQYVNTQEGVYYSTPADNHSTSSDDDVTQQEIQTENPYEPVSF